MRIDKFTKIINLKNKVFVCNVKTGAMDEIDPSIANEINKLEPLNSFTPLETNLKESLIEDMIDRGYITYYSDKEETDERKWFLEKFKEKAKKAEKTASILLDDMIGNNWCYTDSFTENLTMDKIDFINLLKDIYNKNLAGKIDLWLLLKNRISDWEPIARNVNENGLIINSLFTILKDKTELIEIINWIKNTPSAPRIVNVKYEKKESEYSTITKTNDEIIIKNNKSIFMNNYAFFCPFIYKTFFLDRNGNISYCIKKLINKEQIGNIIFADHTKELKNGHRWSEKLFTAICDKPDSCIYSIYCSKMCPYLISRHESNNNNECCLLPILDGLLKTKIQYSVSG